MKQNKYDDALFFEKYGQMLRSQKGLEGAGEWYEFKKLLPDFNQKSVLDLGCGYGWHCIYAKEHGASNIVGIDISKKMLEVAKEKAEGLGIEYYCESLEDVSIERSSIDIVLSSLCFHYIKDFDAIVDKVFHGLKSGGSFIFSVEHPVFTAEGSQDWRYDKQGNIDYWPVDNYYIEGKRTSVFLGEEVIKYHRTLTSYLNSLLNAGFQIKQIVEPKPTDELLEEVEGMKDELRRPMMLLVAAEKN